MTEKVIRFYEYYPMNFDNVLCKFVHVFDENWWSLAYSRAVVNWAIADSFWVNDNYIMQQNLLRTNFFL